MKISILSPDLSSNCFGRAWLLAKLLSEHFCVELIGPAFNKDVWYPLNNFCTFEIKIFRGHPNGGCEFRRILSSISGDVIYSSKPLMCSFGIGLMKKILTQIPLVLDIDDWEVGFGKSFYDSLPWYKKLNDFRLSYKNWRSYYYTLFLNKLIHYADDITVASQILQSIYGGKVLYHGRDSSIFNPKAYDASICKKKYLPKDHLRSYVIGFIGTPQLYKGIDDLIESIQFIRNKNILLMIVGMNSYAYSRSLAEKIQNFSLGQKVCLRSEIPFEMLPEILSAIDLIVIPQRIDHQSMAQTPAKLFDAMAMSKPILSTAVADIPIILKDCGYIVANSDPKLLGQKLNYIINHPQEAALIGLKAREKFLREYSWRALSPQIHSIFKKYERKQL